MDNVRKRILVTGAGGQLGQCLQKIAHGPDFDFLFCGRKELDITDLNAIDKVFEEFEPHLVINTAAYTQVDFAEEQREAAFAINTVAVGRLAQTCKARGCALIHISTDYVFDGSATAPIDERVKTDPQSVYGASKRAGEQAILNSGLPLYYIIRTSWLYSEFGTNFYKTMLRLGGEREALRVVNDQYGSPTNANDLAGAILSIAAKSLSSKKDINASGKQDKPTKSGIYHYANGGETSWFGFASAIFAKAGIDIKLSPVPSSAYPTKAKRPMYSVLDTSKIRQAFDLDIPEWKQSLLGFMQQSGF